MVANLSRLTTDPLRMEFPKFKGLRLALPEPVFGSLWAAPPGGEELEGLSQHSGLYYVPFSS